MAQWPINPRDIAKRCTIHSQMDSYVGARPYASTSELETELDRNRLSDPGQTLQTKRRAGRSARGARGFRRSFLSFVTHEKSDASPRHEKSSPPRELCYIQRVHSRGDAAFLEVTPNLRRESRMGLCSEAPDRSATWR